MRMLVSLAWRNVWRNRRRSIITILAVVFATLFSVAMRGIQLGTYEVNITFTLRGFAGWLQVQPRGWQETPSLQKTLRWDAAVERALRGTPGVTGVAPRIAADGLLCFRDRSLGAALHGIDPALEAGVTGLHERVRGGGTAALAGGDAATPPVLLGAKLLDNLGAAVGDTLILLAQGADGSLGNLRVVVAGMLKTGSPELDAGAALVDLHVLQEVLGMPGRVNYVALAAASVRDVARVRDALDERLDGVLEAEVLPWQDVLPELMQSLELDNVQGILFLGVLIIVVAFGILNTVLMSVTERFREFGVMLAVGMPHRLLARVVLIEALVITVLGLLFGNLLAWGVNAWLAAHPITFGGEWASMYEEYGFLPEMHSVVDPRSFLNTTLSIFAISLVSAVYPVWRVWKLEPLGGIRDT